MCYGQLNTNTNNGRRTEAGSLGLNDHLDGWFHLVNWKRALLYNTPLMSLLINRMSTFQCLTKSFILYFFKDQGTKREPIYSRIHQSEKQ